jgi:signal transduction histidine kinase
LARRFHKLFEREAALYKQIVARIGSYDGQYKDLPDLFQFVEERTTKVLGLRKLKIFVDQNPEWETNGGNVREAWVDRVLETSKASGWLPVEDDPVLNQQGFKVAYPLRRENKVTGLLALDAASSLTTDARSVLEILADQIAIAVDDSRLVGENVRLERELAQRERLASLGRMAATVAHEIKNPLSAIKSIAQVMREDDKLRDEYGRDLTLIVGETDRLNQSVTQLLSFARRESPPEQPLSVDELLHSVVDLFQASAREQGIGLDHEIKTDVQLTGKCVSALRDALSNLLLNALQASTSGGRVTLLAAVENGALLISVQDSGPGVPDGLRERIWEPFFTTRQRGTGLGLAIVRKRVQEVGGSASLDVARNDSGALFHLRVPIDSEQLS